MTIYLVCGPPGSGKTTWVQRRRRWGDVVVDLDALFAAVTGLAWYEKPAGLLPLVLELRERLLDLVEAHAGTFVNAWIILGGATRAEREGLRERFGARVIVLEVEPGECLRRIGGDERRAEMVEGWGPLVARWWREYERDGGDEVIRA